MRDVFIFAIGFILFLVSVESGYEVIIMKIY